MTAMNLIVQAKAGAAYLLTDTARFRRGGIVDEFHPKVLPISIAGRPCGAIASSGMVSRGEFIEVLSKLPARSVGELIEAFPEVFHQVEQLQIKRKMPERCGSGHLSAVLAVYDPFTGSPRGFTISNDNMLFPLAKYRRYTLQPTLKYLTRFVGQPFPRGTDMCDPRQWNPASQAAALIEAQRLDLFGIEPDTYHAIGGEAHLTRIDATGLSVSVVRSWPDKIGRRINPAVSPARLQEAA